jgi:predicted nucleic acid-binding protein
VIYLDSSVFLARIFAEDLAPSDAFWDLRLASSRLLLYEIWTRIYRRGGTVSWSGHAEALLRRVELVELSPAVLERALHPFPISLRTLDSLHLATMDFLRRQGQVIELASYDQRLLSAAAALGIAAAPL